MECNARRESFEHVVLDLTAKVIEISWQNFLMCNRNLIWSEHLGVVQARNKLLRNKIHHNKCCKMSKCINKRRCDRPNGKTILH